MAAENYTPRSSFATSSVEDEEIIEAESLRSRILSIVKDSENYTIRPGKLSSELGISMDEANAELCGLLKAVGKGSSFHFEDIGGVNTMVFVFPPDFEKRAFRSERNEDFKTLLLDALQVAVKIAKVLTAFGLILSTVIVSIAGMVALVAALVALSRGGGDSRHARASVSRQIHHLFITIRQLLWCYAMFGPTGDDEQDPFFREAAYDTWLILSLCCGNPSSMWFWLRARHLRHRRRRYARGWAPSNYNVFEDSPSDLEGVSLIRRGAWGEEQNVPIPQATEEHRGLLSIAVEFLFGPNSNPGPTEEEKWKLRGAIIVDKSLSRNGSLSLRELAPFVDSPPSNWENKRQIISEGLLIVTHFNGRPSRGSKDEDLSTAAFDFPELVSESRYSTHYSGPGQEELTALEQKSLFFVTEKTISSSNRDELNPLPEFLYEEYKSLTKLTRKQFFHCFAVALLNLIGVIWFAQSLEPGGILDQSLGQVSSTLRWSLIPILLFYAKFFFSIPAMRLVYILIW
eukprot:CAMPEP_0113606984 /NCGR_PEP_ID=MMETSP0017_2-20120614/3145_1 /TAXON_ID=2856 /ORGANISM="Cylindrotheca closterium" /LENGTH=514 /DNA_ID=CAMNT_0000515563 /DNA_START=166 /DNA_END=1707 /DNA_ORIENTATION=+ /assembly_acc=CAM_ASM_000147